MTTAVATPKISSARLIVCYAAILGTLPYLTLKASWVTGGSLGLRDPSFVDSDLMLFANLLTGGMDVVAVVLALAFTYSWGRRIAAPLVLSRLQRVFAQAYSVGEDPLGLITLLLGALLLLGVALLGALSGLGPVIGGLVWGVLPGLAALVGSTDLLGLMYDLGGRELGVGLATWLVMGCLLGSGVLLVGAGLVGTLTRRRPTSRSAG
ncbi:hypothetical protein [Amycolatopsis orientalis]|uniref:hypothetical protein n=1 Tax=Amycolatopsis orientalis TaxID=31958 RepID=UPI0012683182|nr:hypothetical protein [Amycolatopsis orientalis]